MLSLNKSNMQMQTWSLWENSINVLISLVNTDDRGKESWAPRQQISKNELESCVVTFSQQIQRLSHPPQLRVDCLGRDVQDAAVANNMHSPCLESAGQLIQNQEKMLPTHSLHLHMGKSVLVSTILQCKKLQVYTGRNAGLDSLVTYATFGRTKMDV